MNRLALAAAAVGLLAMQTEARAQNGPLDMLVQAERPGAQRTTPPRSTPPRNATPRNPAPAARPFGTGSQARLPPGSGGQVAPAPPGQTPATEPAPLPNRNIEAPRGEFTNRLNPSLEPMVLQPDRRQGMTFGQEHLRETGPDRPFDTIVPGARVRIPFD